MFNTGSADLLVPVRFYKLFHVDDCVVENNKGLTIVGAVFDATHFEHSGNTCTNNTPACSGLP